MNKIYQKSFSYYKNAGFTLIELLVVVLIIGILAAIAVPQYEKAVMRSKFMQAVTAGKALAQAQQVFYLANGTYAEKFEDLDVSFLSSNASQGPILWQHGSCYLDNQSKAAVCSLSQNNKSYAAVLNYYDGKRYVCCSYGASNFEADSLCKQITNQTSWNEGCSFDKGDSGSCHCFAAD